MYALDVTNLRVRRAMAEEGIIDSELVVKSLGNFAGPHVAPDIQQLRWQFHTTQVRNTVRLLKQRIRKQKEEFPPRYTAVQLIPRRQKAAPPHKVSPPERPSASTFKSASSPTLSEVTHRIELAEQLKSEIRQQEEQARKKKRQHEKLMQALGHTQMQLQKDLIRNTAGSASQPKRQTEDRVQECAKTRRSYCFHAQTERPEHVEEQLSHIEARITANRQLRVENLRCKAQKAARTTAKALQYASTLESLRESLEEQRVRDYVARRKVRGERASLTPKPCQPRTAPQTSRDFPESISSPSAAQQTLDFLLRMEEQKLKDEEKQLKVSREHRKYNRKRSRWLEKLLADRQREDQRQLELEQRQAKHYETSIRMMIVRKQGEELRQRALHSPHSKRLVDKLRELHILSN